MGEGGLALCAPGVVPGGDEQGVELTTPTFLIALGAVALAAAIAFGWGARNVAQEIVERAYDKSGEVRERVV